MKKIYTFLTIILSFLMFNSISLAYDGEVVLHAVGNAWDMLEGDSYVTERGNYIEFTKNVYCDTAYQMYVKEYGVGYDTDYVWSAWELKERGKVDWYPVNGNQTTYSHTITVNKVGYHGLFITSELNPETKNDYYLEWLGDQHIQGIICGWGYSIHCVEINYDANGGSGAPSSQYRIEQQAMDLSSSIPYRRGYTFLGWSKDPQATYPDFYPGERGYYADFFTPSVDTERTTLYAVWKKDAELFLFRYRFDDGTTSGVTIPVYSARYDTTLELEEGQSGTYNPYYTIPGMEYQGYRVDGGSLNTSQGTLYLTNDGELEHEYTFFFKVKSKIQLVYVDSYSNSVITYGRSEEAYVPYSQEYDPENLDVLNEWYEYTGNHEVQKNTLVFYNQIKPQSGGKPRVTLNYNYGNYPDEVLVVFYYEPKYKINATHICLDPLKDNAEVGRVTTAQAILSEAGADVSSLSPTGTYINCAGHQCLNYDFSVEGTMISPRPFEQYSIVPYSYHVNLDRNKTDYDVTFYYIKQYVYVKHQYEDGVDIVEPEIKLLPTTEYPKDTIPYYKNFELNKDGVRHPEKEATVNVNPGTAYQELVFKYGEPDIIFDPNDADEYHRELAKKYSLGLVANNMSNQYVNQDANKKYWVLDEKGELKYRFAGQYEDGFETQYNTVITFPFDVYIDGEYVKAGTSKSLDFSYKMVEEVPEEYLRIYEGSFSNMITPVWVDEKDYEITAGVTINYKRLDEAKTKTSQATANVAIVGKIYDFSVTNILGDDIWKASLFANGVTDNGEHEADTLPLGQGESYQNSKYLYGIKQGSKIYFSVNTKGADNNSIKIVPKFYYVGKDGGTVEEVDAYSKGQKITEINLSRKYNSTDNYRITSEYSAELLKGREVYGNIYGTAELGNYGNITLPETTRTPYIGYWTSKTDKEAMYSKTGKTEAELPEALKGKQLELYKTVSHWYGDYMIPQDTKYMPVGKAYNDNEANKYADGFVIVYFSIVSTRGDSHENYLAYNKVTAPNTKTQWLVERNEKGDNIILPKTYANSSGTKTATPWMENPTSDLNGNIAVVIYHTSQSTTQNYDSAGTH